MVTRIDLDVLVEGASAAEGPSIPQPIPVNFGGVDPLGLRQINFDLMDQVFPGINNVGRHIRPYVVVAWACRRAARLAEQSGRDVITDKELNDFVARIEVIYAWSQFLRNPEADLPGRQVLSALVRAESYRFGGKAWENRVEERRLSTAFTAPITYGPALKTLGWVGRHETYRSVLVALDKADAALDAFEEQIADFLSHPALSDFGPVEVLASEVSELGEAWALDKITPAEQEVMKAMLLGEDAPLSRRAGGALTIAAAEHGSTQEVGQVRAIMVGRPSDFVPEENLSSAQAAWRRVQVRQLFRLALEAMFYWTIDTLRAGPHTSDQLVMRFVNELRGRPETTLAGEWLESTDIADIGPIELISRLERALGGSGGLEPAIADAFALCLAEAPGKPEAFESVDRLPLFRARAQFDAWKTKPTRLFLRHVLESWVIAQHTYWSVGRGLADARARGKSILRLKVVADERGWTLAPGAELAGPPVPTPDRLATMISLLGECGLLDRPAPYGAAAGAY